MAPSQPSPPSQLAPETSLCSAIADLLSTSVAPFEDPFSGDFDLWSDSETPALPSSFARVVDTIVRPIVYSLPPASTWNETSALTLSCKASHSTRTSSEVSLASKTRTRSPCDDYIAIKHATLASSNSCSESDTEQLLDATSEGTRSPSKGVGTAPRSRWTTQERSLFLSTVAKLANTLATSDSSSANDTRHLAEMVASVVVTRSAREVQSHAHRAIRKLRARAQSKSVSASIKTLRCIVGSSDNAA